MVILGSLTKSLLRVVMAATIIGIATTAYISAQPFVPVDTQPAQQLAREDLPKTSTNSASASLEVSNPVKLAAQPAPALPTAPAADPCFGCPAETATGTTPNVLCADTCALPSPVPYGCPPCAETWRSGRPLIICPMLACRALDNLDGVPAH